MHSCVWYIAPRMGTDTNKATAQRFFELFSASDIDGVLALMTRIGRLFHRMIDTLTSGLRMTVLSCIAEGDRVALEVTSSGDLKNGRLYRQEYHILMEFRDGRICAVREYLDTQHAHDVWIRDA